MYINRIFYDNNNIVNFLQASSGRQSEGGVFQSGSHHTDKFNRDHWPERVDTGHAHTARG